MKIRVTIDTDKCDLSDMGSMERGTYQVTADGVEHCWYGQQKQAAWILEHYEFYRDDPKLARKIHGFETKALKFMELMR